MIMIMTAVLVAAVFGTMWWILYTPVPFFPHSLYDDLGEITHR